LGFETLLKTRSKTIWETILFWGEKSRGKGLGNLIERGKIPYIVGLHLFALGYIVVIGLKRGGHENISVGKAVDLN